MTPPVQVELEPSLSTVGQARDFVRGSLCRHATESLEIAVLLVSELVTNAIRYAKAPISLLVDCAPAGRVHIGVRDGVRDTTITARDLDVEHPDLAEGGRGLGLVSELAAEWGVQRDPSGKTIWFELDLDAA